MRVFAGDDNCATYMALVRELIEEGHEVTSRVGSTLELENVTIELRNPAKALALPRPGYEPIIGMMEGAQLVAGLVDPDLVRLAAPKIDDFSDFYGAYGPRAANQLPALVQILKDAPDSRRAVLALWSAELDIDGKHKDHPCTLVITFRIRGGRLNMTVHMRSNDVWLGYAYDAVQFAILQCTMAKVLNVLPGTYVHHADSFHLYMRNLKLAKDLAFTSLPDEGIVEFSYAQHYIDGFGTQGCDLAEAQLEAVNAMNGAYDPELAHDNVSNTALMLSSMVRAAKAAKEQVASEDSAIARAKSMLDDATGDKTDG